jgi:hypothetical protein
MWACDSCSLVGLAVETRFGLASSTSQKDKATEARSVAALVAKDATCAAALLYAGGGTACERRDNASRRRRHYLPDATR